MNGWRAPRREPTRSAAFIAAMATLAGEAAAGRGRIEEAKTWARAAQLLAAEDVGAVGQPAVSGSAALTGDPERPFTETTVAPGPGVIRPAAPLGAGLGVAVVPAGAARLEAGAPGPSAPSTTLPGWRLEVRSLSPALRFPWPRPYLGEAVPA